jgi:hypothetical protein
MTHRTAAELEAGLAHVEAAPRAEGPVRLVVRRPGRGTREVIPEAELDVGRGLVGDDWINRPGVKSDVPSPYAQITVMNARYTELIAGPEPDDWALAGDQLYVDLDLSHENLPAGTRLQIGAAVLEVSEEPHMGCVQFSGRFGSEALKLANSARGRELRLRGLNAVVLQSGTVRRGDTARVVSPSA